MGIHDYPRPGHIPAPPDLEDESRFEPEHDGVGIEDVLGASHLRYAAPGATRPDPLPERIHSGEIFHPLQFADQLQTAYEHRSMPMVHQNPLAWYGEDLGAYDE
jgi:hypothetical protein